MGTYHKNALPSGYELAEYTIDRVLGHGGFGITYLARDNTLGALVAIKEFLPGEIAQRNASLSVLPNPDRQAVRDYQAGLRNFVKEAQALARFKHPHIVRVLRFLEANGTAYVVMEYEEGQGLAENLKKEGPRLDEAVMLRVFIPILNGLHAVHEAKMLHLDIKPENIYLRDNGGPMLIDFGSARRAMTETKEGQRIALTHGYAPIEQYPDKGQQGAWTDIYALGASMYRCISGKRPEDALTRYQAVLKYQTDPLEPAVKIGARRYQPMVLECIDWAMQIYSKDRPQTAREMQDGLMGKRKQAAPTSTPMRFPPAAVRAGTGSASRQFARQNLRWRIKTAIRTGRLLLTMIAIGAALIGAGYYHNDIMLWLRPTSSASTRVPSRDVVESTVNVGVESQTTAAAASVAAPVPVIAAPAVLERILSGHKDWVQSVAFSADGKWVASASTDRSVRIWNVVDGALLATLDAKQGTVNALAYSLDGKWLASAGNDGSVRLWDGYSGGERQLLRGLGGSLFALAFSADGKLIAAAGRDRTILVWETESGKRVASLDGHKGDVFALAFAPDSKLLASAGGDKTVRFWNLLTAQELHVLSGHKHSVLALAFSHDGRWVASGDGGQAVRLWDGHTFTHARTLTNIEASVLSLAFSGDGRWLAAGLADKSILLFEGEERTLAYTLTGHEDFVLSVAFSPDGRRLASSSRDKTIRLWSGK
jgi:serine/threonine protein kinase